MYGWEQAGMSYVSTLGYADRPGFRCGTCFEYPAFDPVKKQILNLRIRPLIVMECTVIAKRYLGLGEGGKALEKFLLLRDRWQKINGNFTLLWHNTQFDNHNKIELYKSILK